MGNRSRYVTAAAAVGAGAVAARRRARLSRARLRRAAKGIHDAILETHEEVGLPEGTVSADKSHAPGHRHLTLENAEPRPPRHLRGRPWTKHAHGMRHPYSGT